MKEHPALKTERLFLRPFESADALDLQRLVGDHAVSNTTTIPYPYDKGLAEKWLSSQRNEFMRGKAVHFAMILKENGALIGNISLLNIQTDHQAELGYWVGREYWRQGFCTEAGRVVLQYAFKTLCLARVKSTHLARNPASGRVLIKLGLQHEGCHHKFIHKSNKFENTECYRIVREDWQEPGIT